MPNTKSVSFNARTCIYAKNLLSLNKLNKFRVAYTINKDLQLFHWHHTKRNAKKNVWIVRPKQFPHAFLSISTISFIHSRSSHNFINNDMFISVRNSKFAANWNLFVFRSVFAANNENESIVKMSKCFVNDFCSAYERHVHSESIKVESIQSNSWFMVNHTYTWRVQTSKFRMPFQRNDR